MTTSAKSTPVTGPEVAKMYKEAMGRHRPARLPDWWLAWCIQVGDVLSRARDPERPSRQRRAAPYVLAEQRLLRKYRNHLAGLEKDYSPLSSAAEPLFSQLIQQGFEVHAILERRVRARQLPANTAEWQQIAGAVWWLYGYVPLRELGLPPPHRERAALRFTRLALRRLGFGTIIDTTVERHIRRIKPFWFSLSGDFGTAKPILPKCAD